MAEKILSEDHEETVKMVPRIDKSEFKEALQVFSKDSSNTIITKDDLPHFLRSIGLNEYRAAIEEEVKAQSCNELNSTNLEDIITAAITKEVPTFDPTDRLWPSDVDVLKAFSVFDQDGNGFIPVQQLKRFLLQAQLEIQEEELEKLIRDHCKIDNDDQINYEEFVQNMSHSSY